MVTDINYSNLDVFAYTNERLIKGKMRGINLELSGLNACFSITEDSNIARKLAENGILMVIPYTNPWSWMNDKALRWTEHILDILIEKHFGGVQPVLCVTGGSMGGHEALTFVRLSRFRASSCLVNCPVCDLEYFASSDKSRLKTLYDAYDDAPDFFAAIKERSAILNIDNMPDIPYYYVQCDGDDIVDIRAYAERYVKAAEGKLDLTYDVCNGKGHCELTEELEEKYISRIISTFN